MNDYALKSKVDDLTLIIKNEVDAYFHKLNPLRTFNTDAAIEHCTRSLMRECVCEQVFEKLYRDIDELRIEEALEKLDALTPILGEDDYEIDRCRALCAFL
jgi:hypothetical protein